MGANSIDQPGRTAQRNHRRETDRRHGLDRPGPGARVRRGWGGLIELATPAAALAALILGAGFALGQPAGDYGDAPDGPGAQTYYPAMFATTSAQARFPTRHNTANSRIGAPGAHHVNVGQEWFGPIGAVPSVEVDATDPADPDGYPNLVNSDGFDDGLAPLPFFIVLTSIPPSATLTFFVSVAAGAPPGPRYVNVLIDWDQNGVWEDIPKLLPEWVARDFVVNVPPGASKAISVPFVWGWNALLAPQAFWVRMTLTRTPVGAGGHNYLDANGCWDGSGQFEFGETEDYLFHPDVPLHGPIPWVPPGAGGGGGFSRAWADVKAEPQSQTVAHGVRAYVDIVRVPAVGGPVTNPSVDWWEVDWGQRGFWLESKSSRMNPNIGQIAHVAGGSGSLGTYWDPPIPGGPPGTFATVTVDSIVHDLMPPLEIWPVNVRVRWPGVLLKTVQAMVFIRHSGMGPFGLCSFYDFLEFSIANSDLDAGNMKAMIDLTQLGSDAFQRGNYPMALHLIENLRQAAVANQAALEADTRGAGPDQTDRFLDITRTLETLGEEIRRLEATTGPCPAPVIQTPENGAWARGVVPITATARFRPLHEARIERWNQPSGAWELLGILPIPEDGTISWPWDTTSAEDGMNAIRVVYLDGSSGREGYDMVHVRVDNTPPAVAPHLVPPPNGIGNGLLNFEVANVPPDFVGSVEIQISADGVHFMTLGMDRYLEDGAHIAVDVSQLAPAPYQVRAAVKDEAGNAAYSEPPFVLNVEPTYASWKREFGIQANNADDDGDSIPAIWEYFYGLNPSLPDPPSAAVFALRPDPSGRWLLYAPHRPFLSGLNLTIERTSAMSPNPAWNVVAENPPLLPAGTIEVPIGLDAPAGFFRIRLSEP